TGESLRHRRPPSRALLHLGHAQRVDQRIELAVENAGEIMRGEADAMVGHAALRKIVGADLGRAVAGAHLRLAHAGSPSLLLRYAQIEQPRTKNLHRLRAVLNL